MVRLLPTAVDLNIDVYDGTATPIKLKLQMIKCGGQTNATTVDLYMDVQLVECGGGEGPGMPCLIINIK